MKIIKVIELNDRIVFCDDIIGINIENNYCPARYQLITKNGTYRINDKDYRKIKEYLLSLNDEVKIIEEKKIPEKLEEYIYIDSLNYNQCNYMFEKLTNKYNEIIDYLKSKGE